jgi:hypothetical protein
LGKKQRQRVLHEEKFAAIVALGIARDEARQLQLARAIFDLPWAVREEKRSGCRQRRVVA